MDKRAAVAGLVPAREIRGDREPAPVPDWLEREDATGRVLRLPSAEEIQLPIDTAEIVAFYSR